MPRKKDHALHAARQQQILEAAKRCFIERGFHRTSMRQILDAAGISAGGAYNYFASKDEMVKALILEERREIDLWIQRLAETRDPLEGTAQLVFDCIAHTRHEDAVLAAQIYAESCRNAEIQQLSQATLGSAREALCEAMRRGAASGQINQDYPSEALAEWVLALIEGYISRLAGQPELNPQAAAKVARDSCRAFLCAVDSP